MIYLTGIIISSFLATLLLTKRDKNRADHILFLWLCATTLHLTMYAVISSGAYRQFPYLLGFELPLPLVHGPFLFLYATAFTNRLSKTGYKLLHFIPFALALVSVLPFLTLSYDDKVQVYRSGGAAYRSVTTVLFAATIISGVVYSLMTLLFLNNHKKSIKERFSYTEKINLQWLFNLTIGLLCIWVIVLFTSDQYIFAAVVLYVLFIGYFGIKQVGIFTNPVPDAVPPGIAPEDPIDIAEPPSENFKYERSRLTDKETELIHKQLLQLIRQEKPHLVPGLTLAMVAQQLAVHPNILSQVINRAEQKSFFDYINTLRVEEFKQKVTLPESQQYTLLSLAFDCGFNSKTAFNRNFRNITGQSPSEYLKEQQIRLSQ